jgi:hypothetical protein
MITLDLSILNQKGTPMFNSDIFANRPTFGIPGRIFISTNTLEIYRDTGSAWNLLGGGGGGGTISGSIATGQVAFGTAANTIGGNNNLFWDAANNRLGIGTNTPLNALSVRYNNNAYEPGIVVTNTNASNTSLSALLFTVNGVNGGGVSYQPSNYILAAQASTLLMASAGNNKIGFVANSNQVGVAQDIYFSTFGSNTTYQLLIKGNTNNLLVNQTTDTGERLQVTGTMKVTDTGVFSKKNTTNVTSSLVVGDDVAFGTSSNEAKLTIGSTNSRSGLLIGQSSTRGLLFNWTYNATPANAYGVLETYGGSNPLYIQTAGGNVGIGTTTDTGERLQISGNVRINAGIITTGTNLLTISETFAPISGSDTSNLLFINPVINQTGTATGQTRGLWVNPTLTAASDWRSIQWSNNTGFGLFGNGLAPNYILGNLQLGSLTPIGSDINLQVTGKAHIYNFTSYSSGAIQPFVIDKQIAINTNISASTGICNYVSTGDNIFQSSRSVPESTTYANIYAFNKYQFGAAGVTFTATQATPGVRAISQITTQNVFKGANSGTITHMAGIQILGYYNDNTGTITPVIPNAYQLLINDTGGYGHTFTFTNRWGIYQEGINDRNYLAGNLILNSTIDTGQILQVNGAIRVNGQASGSAGGNSGNHLIINVDGTQYKIALLNP